MGTPGAGLPVSCCTMRNTQMSLGLMGGPNM